MTLLGMHTTLDSGSFSELYLPGGNGISSVPMSQDTTRRLQIRTESALEAQENSFVAPYLKEERNNDSETKTNYNDIGY